MAAAAPLCGGISVTGVMWQLFINGSNMAVSIWRQKET